MENDFVKKMMWSGLRALVGAIAALAAHKTAEQIWVRAFNEDPPVD